MTTATLNPKRKSAKPTGEPLRTINGLTFTPTCPLDESEQFEADEINADVDDLARREEELQNERAHLLRNWRSTTPNEWSAASEKFQPRVRSIEEEKREILIRRIALLPKCQQAYMRDIREAEANEQSVLDGIEKKFRDQGIDEFSLPGEAGANASANFEGAKKAFRIRLGQEPEALAARTRLNKAKSNLNVLVSQFPIVPTDNNCCIKWRAIDVPVPAYVSQLFV